MKKQEPVFSVRLPKELDAQLTEAATRLDLSKNDIARHAIRAAVAAIEANGYRIELPFQMEVKKGEPVVAPVPEKGAFAAIRRASAQAAKDQPGSVTQSSPSAPDSTPRRSGTRYTESNPRRGDKPDPGILLSDDTLHR